jgi:hypothetical protein
MNDDAMDESFMTAAGEGEGEAFFDDDDLFATPHPSPIALHQAQIEALQERVAADLAVESKAREGITAEAVAREESIAAEAKAREEALAAFATEAAMKTAPHTPTAPTHDNERDAGTSVFPPRTPGTIRRDYFFEVSSEDADDDDEHADAGRGTRTRDLSNDDIATRDPNNDDDPSNDEHDVAEEEEEVEDDDALLRHELRDRRRELRGAVSEARVAASAAVRRAVADVEAAATPAIACSRSGPLREGETDAEEEEDKEMGGCGVADGGVEGANGGDGADADADDAGCPGGRYTAAAAAAAAAESEVTTSTSSSPAGEDAPRRSEHRGPSSSSSPAAAAYLAGTAYLEGYETRMASLEAELATFAAEEQAGQTSTGLTLGVDVHAQRREAAAWRAGDRAREQKARKTMTEAVGDYHLLTIVHLRMPQLSCFNLFTLYYHEATTTP